MNNQLTFFKTAVIAFGMIIFLLGIPSSTLLAGGAVQERKFPGVYFVEFDASALVGGGAAGSQVILPSIYTIHDDGSVHGVDGTDGGLGPLPGFLIQTPTQGVWKAVGRRSVRLRSLYFGFSRPEDAGGIHGVLQAVSRLTANVYFDRDYNGGTGLACLEDIPVLGGQYDPEEHNPLDLAPIKCTEDADVALPFSFQRLKRRAY